MNNFKKFDDKHKRINSINQLSGWMHYISVLDHIIQNEVLLSKADLTSILDRYEKASTWLAKLILEDIEETINKEEVTTSDRQFGFNHNEGGPKSIEEDG